MSRPLVRWTFSRAAAWLQAYGARVFDTAERTIGPAEVLRIIHCEALDRLDDWLPRAPEPPALQDDAALARVARAFDLTPVESAALALIAAPTLRVEVERLYRFLRADDRPLTLGFVAELLTETAVGFDAAMATLHPDRTLARLGLVALGQGVGQARTVRISADILDVLRGIEPQVGGGLAPVEPAAWPCQDRLEAALAESGVVHLIGPPGSGRLAALTAALGRRPIGLDLGDQGVDPTVLARCARIARLGRSPLVLRIDAPLPPADVAVLRAWTPPVPCVILAAADVPLPRPDHRIVAPRLTRTQQAARWRALLGDRWAADLPDRLAERFDLGPGRMSEALASAPADEAQLLSAVRACVPHRLGAFAERSSTRMTWDDVVLPELVEETLRQMVACARNRARVLDEWGFDRLLPYGRGLGCLFAGPPGTGKTMMAGIVANTLRRELYRVDLSRLVSKWLGETEKNLSRLFAEAAKARAILFFDEADSLFARRTGVKSSNDRHANMEVNHLLQKMERYDGISILATNLEGSIDEAFKRRLRFVVHFEAPDASARAALWRRMIPSAAPLADGVRFGRLGRQFKLTGGHIKNAVVRAAYLAADAGQAIDEAVLVRAAEAETRALGRL